MTAYRVIGIDPALTNVGLCVVESPAPGQYEVTDHQRATTKPTMAMLERTERIRQVVDHFLWGWVAEDGTRTLDAIVIEDPTGQVRVKTKGNNPRTIAVMGLAVGVVVATVQDFLRGLPDQLRDRNDVPELAFLDTDVWMPKGRSGRFDHILARPEITRFLHSRIAIPEGVSEHVVMAAGVARFWIEQTRLARRVLQA